MRRMRLRDGVDKFHTQKIRVHIAETIRCLPKSMFFFHSNENFSQVYSILHCLASFAATHGDMTKFCLIQCKKIDVCYFQLNTFEERIKSSLFSFLMGGNHGGLHPQIRSTSKGQQSENMVGDWVFSRGSNLWELMPDDLRRN